MENPNTASAASGGIVTSIKDRASAQITSQKQRATEELDALAHATRETTKQLRSDQHEMVAYYLDKAADQLQTVAESIRRKDLNDIVRDVQNVARRQPALVIGGGFVAGMLAARFLKSSPEHEGYADRTAEYGSAAPHAGFGDTSSYAPPAPRAAEAWGRPAADDTRPRGTF